jgi:hypothetical protein
VIILSGVLVIVAIALLVAGIVAGNAESAQVLGMDALVVIYISIAVSVVSALCLAIGVFLRRDELRGTGATAGSARKGGRKGKGRKAGKASRSKTATPVPATGRARPAAPVAKDGDADGELEIPPPPADVPDDAVVFVVRGRKRYHLDTCRQLAGRDREDLTYAEAKEEGFSPCTACMPDTALAARAAVSVPAGSAERAGAPGKPDPLSKHAPGKDVGKDALSKDALSKPGPLAKGEPGRGGSRPAAPEAAVTTEFPATGSPITEVPAGAPSSTLAGAAASGAGSVAEPEAGPEVRPSAGPPPSAWPAPGPATVSDIPVGTGTSGGSDPVPAAPETAPPAWDAPDDGPRPEAEPVAPVPSVPSEPEPAPGRDDGGPVRILSGTKRFHRADCSLIEDIGEEAEDLETISRAEAMARGCTPCLVCRPGG